jgi:hypothetical protein
VRPASDVFGQLTAGSRSQRLVVDVFYDDEPVFQNLPISDWSLTWDLESELKGTGTLEVAYTSEAGESLSPREFLDVLAPYGQEINVLMEVSAGPQFAETIQLGRYRINQAPSAADSFFRFQGRTLSAGSVVQIEVDDLLSSVKRRGFHWPEPPQFTASTWDEVQRITDLPVNPNLPDLPTPSGLIYQPKEGGRLQGMQQLISYLGGIGVTNSFGEVTAIPYGLTGPVATLAMGQEGRVISASTSVDSDSLYNVVVGDYQEKDGTPLFVDPVAATGALSPDGPFGEYTYYDSNENVHTVGQAQARMQSILDRLIEAHTFRIVLSCIADYRLEQGDIVTFQSLTGYIVGRIIALKFTADGLMEVTLDVRP